MSCAAVFCLSRSGAVKDLNLSFHKFPKCPETRRQWIEAVRRENWKPTKFSRLCCKHFTKSCFINGLSIRKLKSDAVPTIFEGYPAYYRRVAKKRKPPRQREGIEVIRRRQWKRMEEGGVNTEDIPTTHRHALKVTSVKSYSTGGSAIRQPVGVESGATNREEFVCNGCKKGILTFRYSCLQCPELYIICQDCEKNGVHASHYMLRTPHSRDAKEASLVFQKLRGALVSSDEDQEEMDTTAEADPIGVDNNINIKLEEPENEEIYLKGEYLETEEQEVPVSDLLKERLQQDESQSFETYTHKPESSTSTVGQSNTEMMSKSNIVFIPTSALPLPIMSNRDESISNVSVMNSKPSVVMLPPARTVEQVANIAKIRSDMLERKYEKAKKVSEERAKRLHALRSAHNRLKKKFNTLRGFRSSVVHNTNPTATVADEETTDEYGDSQDTLPLENMAYEECVFHGDDESD